MVTNRRMYMNFSSICKLCIEYVKDFVLIKIKPVFLEALKSFKDNLWKELKEIIHDQIVELLKFAEESYSSQNIKIKKDKLIEDIINKIKLPLIFKPFKKLLHSYISKKVEEVIQELFEKGHEFID